ncbi:TRAP transporter substrate-binding protein [Halocella sp. SP3-1]|uniref:TRAP transporter substrate-binding protein n=1 Tax=Halocella sp. SP3-1 TaxID=2382161 RepID=UPI000F7554B7|nr:TRAP transporter substrate-binding protein [Halocella sp. SP3-1]AZO93779.1 TRAP transporter substrate-binding protein [Halocella sp. SP3-1]
MKKLTLCSLLVVVLLVGMANIGFAAPQYKWSLASVLPETHPVHKALVYFADKVYEHTDGQVKVTVYPAGQLGQEKDFIEGLQLGTIDIAKVSSAPLGQFSKTLQVVSLPFIFRDIDHQHAVLRGSIGEKLMSDLYDNGFKGLTFLDSGFRSVTNSVRPIRKPADLEGLKIRVMKSKPLIDTINAFGATAVPMGQSEVYVALQQNVIDGWENSEPTVIAFNMQEVAKYYSYTRHVAIPDILIMRKDLFASVPKDIQKGIMDAARETAPYQTKVWNEFVNEAIKQLKNKGMVFNEVDNIEDFQEVVQAIYDKYGQEIGKDLIDSIINY